MSNKTLATVSLVLGLLWIACYFFLHLFGGYVHLLLVLAVIFTFIRISRNPVR